MGLVAASLVVALVAGVLLGFAIDGPMSRSDVNSALQTFATLALVAITAWYAWLTHSLVVEQRRAPRLAAQERAVDRLITALNRVSFRVGSAQRAFPLEEHDPSEIRFWLKETQKGLVKTREALEKARYPLPAAYWKTAADLERSTVRAEALTRSLRAAVRMEATEAESEGRPWTVEGVRANFDQLQGPPFNATFEDVADGSFLADLDTRFTDFEVELEAHLFPDELWSGAA